MPHTGKPSKHRFRVATGLNYNPKQLGILSPGVCLLESCWCEGPGPKPCRHGCRNFKAQPGTILFLLLPLGGFEARESRKGFDLCFASGEDTITFSAAYLLVTRQDRRYRAKTDWEQAGQVDPLRW